MLIGGGGKMADIESVYGAWCMESIRVRRSRRLYKVGTGDLASIGRAHYHHPWISPRIYFNTLTGGGGRDAKGWEELVVHS